MTADLFHGFKTLAIAKQFTIDRLEKIREELRHTLVSSESKDKITIITTGSYGRGEASEESDLDLFIIFDADQLANDAIPAELDKIKNVVECLVPNSVGDSGTFGAEAVISFTAMISNIGGKDDTNDSLTRRMLFLLEGTWLYGESRFRNYQEALLNKYIQESSPGLSPPM